MGLVKQPLQRVQLHGQGRLRSFSHLVFISTCSRLKLVLLRRCLAFSFLSASASSSLVASSGQKEYYRINIYLNMDKLIQLQNYNNFNLPKIVLLLSWLS